MKYFLMLLLLLGFLLVSPVEAKKKRQVKPKPPPFNLAEWDARNQKRNERLADMPEGVNFRRQRLDRKDN